MLIGLSGKVGSGKDTVFGIIKEMMISNGVDIVSNAKFSLSLKIMAGGILKVDPNKFEDQEFKASQIPTATEPMTYRDFLLELGTGIIRRADPDFWVKSAFSTYNGYDFNEDWIVFTDTRFINEAEAIREKGGKVIRVNMVGNNGVDHESDTQLDDYDFDYVISAEKGDLDGLRDQIANILAKICFGID